MSRALACILVAVLFGAASALRTVCYYTNWAQYRNGAAKFFPENVDPSLCTHLIYAFAKMNGNHLAAFEWNDESTAWSKGMYERFHDLKAQNPSLKLLLSVGGWNMGSPPFTAMVASDANRREFARTSIAFLRKNNFDGLDVDWEYPANRGSPPEDKGRYVQLLQTLRDAFDAESVPAGKDTLMLAAAVGAGKEKIDTGYDVPKVAQLLDMINLMTYDLHGSWEDHTGHHSALYARTGETGDDLTLNVNWAAQQWVQKGAPRSKINIGVPLYGRTFKLPSGHSNELIGCPASGAGPAGTFTREAGFMSWYEICTKLPTANKHFDTEQQVPYMVKDNLWVGYEDPDSLRIKVDYIKKENFGGVMVWALDLDDFSGMCSTHVKYPLMRAIKDEIDNGHSSVPVSDFTTKTTPTTVQTTPSTKRSTTQSTTTSTTMRTTKQTQPPPVTAAPSTSKHSVIPVPSTEFDCSQRFTGYYPSATSCSSFYICAAGNSFKTDCHPGLVFNPQTLYCDFPDHVTCYAHNPLSSIILSLSSPTKAVPTMRIPTLPSSTKGSTKGSNNLGFCNGKSDGYYKDPKDCARFYECVYGSTYHLSCPLSLFYNENTRGCDYAYRVTCP